MDPFGTGGKVYSNPLDPQLIKNLFSKPVSKILEAEINAIKRDVRELSGIFGGKRPKGAKSSMQTLADAGRILIYSNRAIGRMIAARYGGRAKQLIDDLMDKLATDPGSGRVIKQTFQEEAEHHARSMIARMNNILGNATDSDLQVIGDMLAGRKRMEGTTGNGKKAQRLRRILEEQHKYAKEAGVDIGHVGKNYFPRMTDVMAVLENPADAKAQAEKVYKMMGLDAETARDAAQDWYERTLGVGHGRINANDVQSRFTKGRKWPAEADRIMGDYLVKDAKEVLSNYMLQTSRKAAFARRFGEDGGLADEAFDNMLREGVKPDDIVILRHVLDSSTGLMSATRDSAMATTLSWIQTAGILKLLPRAVFPSAAEGMAIGVQSQSTMKSLEAFARTYHEAFRAKNPDPNDIRQATEMMGFVGDAMTQMMLESRYGASLTSKKQQFLIQKFFKTTMLFQLTEAQRVAASRIGQGFIRQMLDEVVNAGPRKGAAKQLLADLGIAEEDATKLMNWLGQDKGMPKIEKLLGQDPEAQQFRAALGRFIDQSIQSAKSVDVPYFANHPIGKMAYGVMRFIFGFTRNVTLRTGKQAWKAMSDPDLSLADRKALLSSSIAFSVLAATQMGISDLRDILLNPQAHERRKEIEKWLLRFSRAGLTGTLDPIIQAFTAIRYNRDLSSVATGPYVSSYLDDVAKISQGLMPEPFSRNSPNTNTAEFNAIRAAYYSFMSPISAAAMSMVPAGPIMKIPFAAALQYATAPQRSTEAAESLVGPKGSKTGGGRSLSGRGGGRRSGGRELRGR